MTKKKFIIEPHFRLQEWVAEEKGYFAEEGLDYEFVSDTGASMTQTLQPADFPLNPRRRSVAGGNSSEGGRQ